jgi:putative flippase GtrA
MDLGSFVRSLGNFQSIRFLIVGAVNTLFGLGVYVGCVIAGLPAWLAMLVGTVAGIAFNFVSLGSYAFRDLSLWRLPRFVCCYGVTYLVNLAAFHLLRSVIADPIVCQIALTLPMAMFSYLTLSRFVFRQAPSA